MNSTAQCQPGHRDVNHHGVGPGVAKQIEDVCLVELVQEVKESLEDPARSGAAASNISLFHRRILAAWPDRACP
jgi:hypothetical protein